MSCWVVVPSEIFPGPGLFGIGWLMPAGNIGSSESEVSAEWVSATGGVVVAFGQIIERSGVCAAVVGARGGRFRSARKIPVERKDDIGQVDGSAVVGIRCIMAGWLPGAQEKVISDKDGIAEAEFSTEVSIGAFEMQWVAVVVAAGGLRKAVGPLVDEHELDAVECLDGSHHPSGMVRATTSPSLGCRLKSVFSPAIGAVLYRWNDAPTLCAGQSRRDVGPVFPIIRDGDTLDI